MARTSRLLAAVPLAVALAAALPPPVSAQQPRTGAVERKRPGSPSDHTWLFDQKYTWSSCDSITYRVNPSAAPRGWEKLVKKAVRKVEQASRLEFRYLGKTKVKPTSTAFNPPDTDLVIAFLKPGQTDMLPGPTVAGQGSAASDGSFLFDGKVVLNAKVLKKMASGFGSGPRYGIQGTTGQVVMHELAHVLGLGHARHQTQVMFPAATRKPAEWGAGDWAGLRQLGRGPCDPTPGVPGGRVTYRSAG
jgi:hypothetical protein